jgi:glycosyltransferase involved in cell wall biosynthesis
MTDLSIVIPAYNEERRLPPTLEGIAAWAAHDGRSIEVIVVDDGSTDATSTVAEVFAGRFSGLRVIRSARNRGKGNAVRAGMLAASGDLRLFADADGATPISELAKLEDGLRDAGGRGVAFGSIAGGEHVQQGESALRSMAGRLGNWLIQRLALPGVCDSQRGFKLFSADAADDVFGSSVIDGWGFDVEALSLARRCGYPLVEVATRWSHDPDTRVTAFSYLTTLWEVLRIRWRMSRDRAGRPVETGAGRSTPV